MKKRKRQPTRKNGIARALEHPQFRQRVKPDKKRRMSDEEFLDSLFDEGGWLRR